MILMYALLFGFGITGILLGFARMAEVVDHAKICQRFPVATAVAVSTITLWWSELFLAKLLIAATALAGAYLSWRAYRWFTGYKATTKA